MKTTIVTTTINVPTFLAAYRDNADRFGHEIDYVVVGDRKTDPEAAGFCEDEIPNCKFMDTGSQIQYMSKFPALAEHHPWDCIERRNIGILWAYENGSDRIITLDDDNLATPYDMIEGHKTAGRVRTLPTYRTSSGWFNVCQFLKEENYIEFYHRGYSPKNRWVKDIYTVAEPETNRVVVNAGFWLDDPDIDAITRMERKLKVTGYQEGFPGTIALGAGTWSPFDCQNTALVRDVIPAYFLSPCIGRHSDIFASYIINKLVEHSEDVIAFGNPLVLHNRHPHNLFKDYEIEKEGMQLTDSFCEALRGIRISAPTYHQGFGQIIRGLEDWAWLNKKEDLLEGMRLWHEAFEDMGVV